MTQINITRKLTQADKAKLVELGLMEEVKEASPKGKKLTQAVLKGLKGGNYVANQKDFASRCSGLTTTANPNRKHTLKGYEDNPWHFVDTKWLSRWLPEGSRAIAPKGVWDIRISGLKTTFLVHYSEVRIIPTK